LHWLGDAEIPPEGRHQAHTSAVHGLAHQNVHGVATRKHVSKSFEDNLEHMSTLCKEACRQRERGQ
jgi:hypothetical protein